MRVLAGRSMSAQSPSGTSEALIDRHLAEQFFPTGSLIGATIPFGEKQQLTVVGVVDHARLYDVHRDGRPQLYMRAEDWQYRTLNYAVQRARSGVADCRRASGHQQRRSAARDR